MDNEERKTIYRDNISERQIFESKGLTNEEYIIRRFEEETGIKFDPSKHEIIVENNAYDDGYDNPLSTFSIVEKKKTKVKPPIKTGPGNGPGRGGSRPPRGPISVDGPIFPPVGGGVNNPNPPEREPGRGPQIPEEPTNVGGPIFPPIGGGENNPEPPEREPGREPQIPEEPTNIGGPIFPPIGGGEDNPEPPEKEPGDNEPEPPEKEPGDNEPEPPEKEPGDNEPEPPEKEPGDNEPEPPEKEPGKEPQPPRGPINDPIPPGGKPIPTPQLPPILRSPDEGQKEKDRLVQDMLDKYYGNPSKRREYIRRYKRFKSHVIDKKFQYVDQNGALKNGTCKTIDTSYPEYEEDAQFLQLKEYGARLERLTRATYGDVSLYRIIINDYVRSGQPLGMSEENAINLLLALDQEYVETNNYAYNAHQATNENLKTLGKHGERVSYIPMSKEKTAKAALGNVVATLVNGGILVRNYTTAPIHRLVGKGVVSKIHGMIFDPKKSPAGVYAGQRTHRYEARKVYFQSLYLQGLEEENARRIANNQPLVKSKGLVFAFKPRFQAIFKYQEGNRAVLNAGAHDIDMAYEAIQQEKQRVEGQRSALIWQINQKLQEIQYVRTRLSTNKDETYTTLERAKDERYLGNLENELINLQQQLRLLDFSDKDIIQTDAISLSTHDMANKENVTKVVTGVKLAAKLAAGYFIAKRIKTTKVEQEEIIVSKDKVVKTDPTYEVITEGEEVVPYSVDYNNVTLGDLLEESDVDTVTRVAANANKTVKAKGDIIRGISFKNGHLSVGDKESFVTSNIVDAELQISPNDRLLDVYARALNKIRHTDEWTEARVIEILNNKNDPLHQTVINDLESTSLWLSSSYEGKPRGWFRLSDVIHVNDEVVKPVERVIEIPGEIQIIPEFERIIREIPKEVIDWRWDAARKMILISTLEDLNEILRRTRDKEEVLGEKSYAMPLKNQEVLRETKVPAHQRDNKKRYGKRHYTYDKYHFVGTKDGDRASGYNEAGMGTPGDVVVSSRRR